MPLDYLGVDGGAVLVFAILNGMAMDYEPAGKGRGSQRSVPQRSPNASP